MTNTFLYIDPGTGSMLFSILIGAAATLFFLAKALVLKLKVFFSGKKSGVVLDASHKDFVIYNEGKQYYNVFKPILDECQKRGLAVTYYTSAKDDAVFSDITAGLYTLVTAEYIGEGNAAYAKLNMLSASIVLMTTPSLQVYQLKRSKKVYHYSHILHMPNDATTYKLFGLDYFDSVLLTGDYQKRDIQYLEEKRHIAQKQLVTVGCTYLDTLSEKLKALEEEEKAKGIEEEKHNFTVLVSPSWGPVSVLNRFGERLLDPLVATGWTVIIRPHPQSKKSEPQMLATLTERYKQYHNVEWDYERDNIFSLRRADIMISDFSGIIFDYTFLFDKPVMYVKGNMDLMSYDAYDLDHELWQFQTLAKMGLELREEDFPRIKEVIKNASDSAELQKERQIAKETAWQHPGKAGERVVDFVKKIIDEADLKNLGLEKVA